MSLGRSAREEAEFERHHYPHHDKKYPPVLINKDGVHNFLEQQEIERRRVVERLRQGFPSDAHERSYTGFKALHRHMFQDVYQWAGQERTYTTGRGAAPFAPPEHITPWMEKRFELFRRENRLIGLGKKDFATRAAEHVNEINAAHPFIEGNGRVQRTWLRMVSENAGYTLRLTSQDKDLWNEASRIGFERADHSPMVMLIHDRLEEVRSRDRTATTREQYIEQARKRMKEAQEQLRLPGRDR